MLQDGPKDYSELTLDERLANNAMQFIPSLVNNKPRRANSERAEDCKCFDASRCMNAIVSDRLWGYHHGNGATIMGMGGGGAT